MKWFKKIDFDGLNEEAEVIREEERQIAPGYTCDPKLAGHRRLPFAEVHIKLMEEEEP